MKNFNEKIVLAKSVGQYEFLQRKKVLTVLHLSAVN